MRTTNRASSLTLLFVMSMGIIATSPTQAATSSPFSFEGISATAEDSATTILLTLRSHDERVTNVRVDTWVSRGWAVTPVEDYSVLDLSGQEATLAFSVTRQDSAESDIREGDFMLMGIGVRGLGTNASGVADFAFEYRNAGLRVSTKDAYIGSQIIDENERGVFIRFTGALIGRDEPLSALPPDVQSAIELQLQRVDVEVQMTHSALSLDSDADANAAGCATTAPSSFMALIIATSLLGLLRWHSRRQWSLLAALPMLLFLSSQAMAATRCFVGYAAFWDPRSINSGPPYIPNDYPGWNLQTCDTADATCVPSDADCCWSYLRSVRVELVQTSGTLTTVDSEQADDSTGAFTVCDNNWISGDTYRLEFGFTHPAAAPARFEIRHTYGNAPWVVAITVGQMTSSPTNLGMVGLNAAFETLSLGGDLSSAWATITDFLFALENEGETRHRREAGSANAFDLISYRYTTSITGADATCSSPQTVRVSPEYTRNAALAHETGHIYGWRVASCSFPASAGFSGHDRDAGEGTALVEAIADFSALYWAYDQDTALLADIRGPDGIFGCEDTEYVPLLRSNEASSTVNNALALYDFLDTSTTDSDNGVSDSIDVSFRVLMDALEDLSNASGSPGANRTADEPIFNLVGGSSCSTSEDCGTNQICNPGNTQCLGGDVHGANVRDWVDFLPFSQTSIVNTLVSSKCILPADNTGNLDGGYHSD